MSGTDLAYGAARRSTAGGTASCRLELRCASYAATDSIRYAATDSIRYDATDSGAERAHAATGRARAGERGLGEGSAGSRGLSA
eukprot:989304-Rhodomonas_salina.1